MARCHRTVLAYWKFESISLQRRVRTKRTLSSDDLGRERCPDGVPMVRNPSPSSAESAANFTPSIKVGSSAPLPTGGYLEQADGTA